MTMVRIGMVQMVVEGAAPRANLERAVGHIAEAAAGGCQAVVLPECLDLGWTDPSARTLAQPIPGPHTDMLAAAAAAHGVYVIAGLVERAGDRLYNAAVLLDRAGQVRLLYRKINELDLAHDLYAQGDRLGVAETDVGTIGLNICADNFSDSLAIGHVLARMGAQILLSPSAWAVEADHDNTHTPYGELWRASYQTLSRLYAIPVIGVSGVGWITAGPWAGRKLIGCSLAIGAGGTVQAQGPYGEAASCVLCVDVPLQEPLARGTAMAEALRRRGYDGP